MKRSIGERWFYFKRNFKVKFLWPIERLFERCIVLYTKDKGILLTIRTGRIWPYLFFMIWTEAIGFGAWKESDPSNPYDCPSNNYHLKLIVIDIHLKVYQQK